MDGPTEEGYCFSVLGEPGESSPSYYNPCGIWPGSTCIVDTNLMGTVNLEILATKILSISRIIDILVNINFSNHGVRHM